MNVLHGHIILGLKIQFKDIWENIGNIVIPTCYCDENDPSKNFCPVCGTKNKEKIIPQYHNLLTHTISSYRDIDSMFDILSKTNISVFDQHPDGYTDEPIFIYLKNPNCNVEICNYDPVKFYLFDDGFDIENINKELQKTIHEKIYNKGDFGLWFIPCFVEDHDNYIDDQEILNKMDKFISIIKDSKTEDT